MKRLRLVIAVSRVIRKLPLLHMFVFKRIYRLLLVLGITLAAGLFSITAHALSMTPM